MPFKPDGTFVPDDASVSKQLTNVLDTDSPLLTRARTGAAQVANRRGLLNSSLAVQAGEAAVLDVALPIASQQAGQIQQSNLQRAQIGSTEALAARGIESTEALAARELGSRSELLATELGSRETLTREALRSQESTSAAEIAGRQVVSAAGLASQERIAASNVASFERDRATAALAQFDAGYQESFRTISTDENLPSATRTTFLSHLSAIRDTNFNLVEQLYNIDLVWRSAIDASPSSSSAPAPIPPVRTAPPTRTVPPTPTVNVRTAAPSLSSGFEGRGAQNSFRPSRDPGR